MSRPALDDLIAGVDLGGAALALIDYNAMTRSLTLRFEPADTETPQTVTLVFASVVGLHCEPQGALHRLEAGERATIDRLDAKRRKNGETEITLVYLRGGARTACVVSFSAQEGRWLG
ncbi:MAG: hypothetical protein H6872_00630 [Methylobacteriaceae bacterium]|nr:hypothetical protein [Methylobacteriaceae bacterium]